MEEEEKLHETQIGIIMMCNNDVLATKRDLFVYWSLPKFEVVGDSPEYFLHQTLEEKFYLTKEHYSIEGEFPSICRYNYTTREEEERSLSVHWYLVKADKNKVRLLGNQFSFINPKILLSISTPFLKKAYTELFNYFELDV